MFIVEMQGAPEKSYGDRMLCYASFPIRLQIEKKLREMEEGIRRSSMDYGLMPIYVVSIVNFHIPHERMDILEGGLISQYGVCSPITGEAMTESLHFAFFELGRLDLKFGEMDKCKTTLEQLAYSLKYMHKLTVCPEEFKDPVFPLLYGASEYAQMSVEKQMQVTRIMRTEIDIIAQKEYAREEGFRQGKAEGKAERARTIARNLRELGVDLSVIGQATGLGTEEILAL